MTVDHSWQVRPDLTGHHPQPDDAPGPGTGCVGVRPGDPREIGGYPLVALLASGHRGCTYLGDSDAGPVAIKLLEPSWIEDVGGPSSLTRSLATARRLDTDTGIAAVLEVRMEQGQSFVVSEFVAGPSVDDVVRTSGALPPEAVVRLAVATASGLATIHGAGLAHGSLHPRRVLLGPDGPRIVDVGLSPGPRQIEPPRGDADSGLPRRNASTRGVQQADVLAWAGMIAFAAGGDAVSLAPDGRPALAPTGLDDLPGGLAQLVHECLVAEPARRPSAPELVRRLANPVDGPNSVHQPDAVDGPASPGPVPDDAGPGATSWPGADPTADPTDGITHGAAGAPSGAGAELPAQPPVVDRTGTALERRPVNPGVLVTAGGPAQQPGYHLPSTAEIPLGSAFAAVAPFESCPPTVEIPVFVDDPLPDPPRGPMAAFLHWATGGAMSHRRVSLLVTAALMGTIAGSLLGAAALHEVTSPRPAAAAPVPASDPSAAADDPAASGPASGGRAACSAVYRVVERWPGGFKGEVTVTAGEAPLRIWKVTLPLAGAQGVTQWWNTSVTTLGTGVEARNVDWNGAVAAGASTTFGFVASLGRVPADRAVDCAAE